MQRLIRFNTYLRFLIFSALLCMSAELVWGGKVVPGPEDYEPGVVLVKFRATMDPERLRSAAQALGIPATEPAVLHQALKKQVQAQSTQSTFINMGVERWVLSKEQSVSAALQQLEQSALIDYVQPNYKRIALAPRTDGPNDTNYQNGNQWWLEAIQADRVLAEQLVPAGSDIILAILDSGILLLHEDLAARLVPGVDLVNLGGDGNDDEGHGTHVAGIAGATTNNHLGIAGVTLTAPVKLMPVKVLNSAGDGYDYDIARGIIWAADHGARVLNMSFGGQAMGKVLEDAVSYATNKGCVLVASAGNSASESNPVMYPAAYGPVIAVAACTTTGDWATYSGHQNYIDLAAPGGSGGVVSNELLSTYSASVSAYAYAYGTSMAAPVVSGVAAMLLVQNSQRTPEEVLQLMSITADKVGTLSTDSDGWNQYLGWGRVNLYQALTRTITFKPKPIGRASYNFPNPFAPAQGEMTNILVPAFGSSVRLRIFDSVGYLVYEENRAGVQVYAGQIIQWDGRDQGHDWVANGVYPYVLEVGGTTYTNKIVVLNK